MATEDENKYPKQRLLFFVAQDVDDEMRESIRRQVATLGSRGPWLISPPVYVDTIDDSGTRLEDVPDETVGAAIQLYSSLEGTLPVEVDEATLFEVERFVDLAKDLSTCHSLEIEFELDGVFVGAIEDGVPDKSLAEGFLGEWRRHLNID